MLPDWMNGLVNPPPPMRPHVRRRPGQDPGPPVVLEGDERSPTDKAAEIATHFFKEARKRGKSEADAAGIARGQALNFLARIGIFKPQPERYEY
jgi:serine/threonine protein kinase HipA of HipAB toxin-antitoxin module